MDINHVNDHFVSTQYVCYNQKGFGKRNTLLAIL